MKTTCWGFLQVSEGTLCWHLKSALDPPPNGMTSSVSLLNAKSLSQRQIFRVWGGVELHFRPMDLSIFHLPLPFFCLVVSLQLLICFIPAGGEFCNHMQYLDPLLPAISSMS